MKPWQTEQIAGVVRFQNRVYNLGKRMVASSDGGRDVAMSDETIRLMHQTVQKVTSDVDGMSFNTAISQMMVFSNHLQGLEQVCTSAV